MRVGSAGVAGPRCVPEAMRCAVAFLWGWRSRVPCLWRGRQPVWQSLGVCDCSAVTGAGLFLGVWPRIECVALMSLLLPLPSRSNHAGTCLGTVAPKESQSLNAVVKMTRMAQTWL